MKDSGQRADGAELAKPKQLATVSESKLKANRENAKKSTGPKTSRGLFSAICILGFCFSSDEGREIHFITECPHGHEWFYFWSATLFSEFSKISVKTCPRICLG
jgi:hypothetical protein